MEATTPSSVLVTGASGFIGGRLAQHLASLGDRVTGTGRKFTPADQITLEKAGVTLARADLRDADAMAKLCEGKEVIYHVAAWLQRQQGSETEAYAINVDATRALAQAALAAGVRRMVLVSSVASYGLPPQEEITEEVPVDGQQHDTYGRTKALGELAAKEVAQGSTLELSIVRPAMVYGPGSTTWTARMLKLVQKGVPVLFGSGDGYAMPVYVDDVLALLTLCGRKKEAASQAFNCSDASIPWTQFFGYYGQMCGRRPRRLPLFLAKGVARANDRFHLGLPLTKDRLDYCVRRLRFPTSKAERLLSFRIGVPVSEGMRRSEEWLRQVGLLK